MAWARDLARTLRTVRYLPAEQVVARALVMAERRLLEARPGVLERRYAKHCARVLPTLRDAPPIWRWPPAPLDPAARAEPGRTDDLLRGEFTFLNQRRPVQHWQAPGASRLWLFHLHGFRVALDLAAAARRGRTDARPLLEQLIDDWIRLHPVDSSDAWHPFVVSERLLAWLIARDLLAFEAGFAERLRRAIIVHTLYLDEHLERDVGGNHLLKNAVALLLAGCAFEGRAAEHWRRRAAAVLSQQLRIQVLPDGGHYERSPMYHLLVLADLLAALLAAGKRELPIAVPLADAVRRMQAVARVLVHTDGDIPLFNDAVLGEAPPPARLIGPSTDAAAECLPWMGYAVLRAGSGVLIADCGPPGPDELPAHVHADALAFELSIGGQRVLVDGGMHEYAAGPLRDRLRGTAAHNTVQVDGLDQTEVYGAFRVGRRARVKLDGCQACLLVAAHDGYGRIGVRHERRIEAVPDRGWRVLDTLSGNGWHTADARLRLHPALAWQPVGRRFRACRADGQRVLEVEPFGATDVSVEDGEYAERFSELQPVQVLRLRRRAQLPMVFGCWLLLPGAEPILT